LNSQACLLHGINAAALERLPSLKTDRHDLALALAILAERRLGTSSQYAAYIELLPGEELTVSLPAWWPEEELLSLLGGSGLVRAAVILLVYCCGDTTCVYACQVK